MTLGESHKVRRKENFGFIFPTLLNWSGSKSDVVLKQSYWNILIEL